MNWLNKIGQRNAAKYLIGISAFISLLVYIIKLSGTNKPTIMAIIFGTVIFCLGNCFLAIAAHKSREHRLMSLFASATIVVLNGLLFFLSLLATNISIFLFIVALIEIICSLIFLLVVLKSEKDKTNKKNKIKNNKETTNTTQHTKDSISMDTEE